MYSTILCNNVKFFSEKDFDTELTSGKLNIQILEVITEFQRNTNVENVKIGTNQRARKGNGMTARSSATTC
ncbi:recombinase family protein [Paenibacillus polymyxa]|uniref:recombinase family protein n=1 Tax=Paenibacillus polymyxa TaxID=1406 RepID=UPI001269251D